MSQEEGTGTSLEEFKQLLLSKLPPKKEIDYYTTKDGMEIMIDNEYDSKSGYNTALSEVERIIGEL